MEAGFGASEILTAHLLVLAFREKAKALATQLTRQLVCRVLSCRVVSAFVAHKHGLHRSQRNVAQLVPRVPRGDRGLRFLGSRLAARAERRGQRAER